MKTLSSYARNVLAALVCFIAVGCTSATVRQSEGSTALGVRVATVLVTPDASIRPSELRWMSENAVEDTLTAAVRQRLTATGKLEPAGATLEVTIISMRLRSTTTAVLWGVLAGPDHLRGRVRLLNKGTVQKTFIAEASRTSGAMAGAGSGGRIEGMCEELAYALVQQL